ncbi:hypothetical protein BOX15_Mlig030218g4, partial [Macrostomum lignano]
PEQLQCRTVCGQGAVRCVRFNADGNYCLTGGADKSLKLWNPAKSLLLRSYLGHGQEVLAVACACDNANLASGGEDKMVAYWDTASGTAVRKYRSHLARVGALDFSPDATLLASGSVDCTVRLWDLRSKAQAPVQLLTDARDSVTAVAVHSWRIYTASLDGRLRCYDARKGRLAEDNLCKPLIGLCATRDGRCILASCSDARLRLIDRDTGDLLASYSGHSVADLSVECDVSAGDSLVLSGSAGGSGELICWDLLSGELRCRLRHPAAEPARAGVRTQASVVQSVSAHPKLCRVLTAMGDAVFLWADPAHAIADEPQ